MGKSWLIWMLLLAIRESGQAASCWISFAPAKRQPPFPQPPAWLARTLLYRPVARSMPLSLQTQPMLAHGVARQLLERWRIDAEQRGPELQRVLGELELQVVLPEPAPAGVDGPLVLFLDGLDQLELNPELDGERIWAALQEHLLRPLYFTGAVLCITTGQAPLVWRFFDLARVAAEQRLNPLDAQDVEALAYERGFRPLADDLRRAAQGHPYLTQWLLDVAADEIKRPLTDVPPPEMPRVADASQPVAQQHIDRLATRLAELPELARNLLPAASLLRMLDLGALHGGVQALTEPHVRGLSMADLHTVLRAYLAADLLELAPAGPLRYHWREAQRVALLRYAEERLAPAQRQTLHQAYATWYHQELKREPKRQRFFLTEWMFQSLRALAPTSEAHQHWLSTFRQLWWRLVDFTPMPLLEADQELQQLLVEAQLWSEISKETHFIAAFRAYLAQLDPQIEAHLLEERMVHTTEALTKSDLELLPRLARLESFTMAKLRATISPETPPSLSEVTARLDRLRANYLVEFDSERNGFVVDPWFKQWLTKRDDTHTEISHAHTNSDC